MALDRPGPAVDQAKSAMVKVDGRKGSVVIAVAESAHGAGDTSLDSNFIWNNYLIEG